jgi:hypothetical protein
MQKMQVSQTKQKHPTNNNDDSACKLWEEQAILTETHICVW